MSGKTVLVIEDNPDNARLATTVLQLSGFSVDVANRAETGIEMARAGKPDLILMDISLPGMDGLEATRILKSDPDTAGIPIVALTAHAMEADRERSMEAGCSGFITKPITVATFGAQITEFMAA